MFISKGKSVRHYVDFVVKVFEENSEITQREGDFECQLNTPKSEAYLDQNWMFVRRVGVQNLDFFCGHNK